MKIHWKFQVIQRQGNYFFEPASSWIITQWIDMNSIFKICEVVIGARILNYYMKCIKIKITELTCSLFSLTFLKLKRWINYLNKLQLISEDSQWSETNYEVGSQQVANSFSKSGPSFLRYSRIIRSKEYLDPKSCLFAFVL